MIEDAETKMGMQQESGAIQKLVRENDSRQAKVLENIIKERKKAGHVQVAFHSANSARE